MHWLTLSWLCLIAPVPSVVVTMTPLLSPSLNAVRPRLYQTEIQTFHDSFSTGPKSDSDKLVTISIPEVNEIKKSPQEWKNDKLSFRCCATFLHWFLLMSRYSHCLLQVPQSYVTPWYHDITGIWWHRWSGSCSGSCGSIRWGFWLCNRHGSSCNVQSKNPELQYLKCIKVILGHRCEK